MKATYWKGHLVPQDPRVKHYCEHTLAQRLTDWKSIAKMLYWRDHPHEPIRDPIILKLSNKGIEECHPGLTRFLSCHLLDRSAPIRLIAKGNPDLRIITRARQMRIAPNEQAQAPDSRVGHRHQYRTRVRQLYWEQAQELSELITHDNAYAFYVDLYKKTS